MSLLSDLREGFIEASVPDGAKQEQIQDMEMAFDAGVISILTTVLRLPTEGFEATMDKIYHEAVSNGKFHAEQR